MILDIHTMCTVMNDLAVISTGYKIGYLYKLMLVTQLTQSISFNVIQSSSNWKHTQISGC